MHIVKSLRLLFSFVAVIVGAQGCAGATASPADAGPTTPESARRLLSVLAHDSLQGRLSGTESAMGAARFIAGEMERVGLEPLGDDGFLQGVPLIAGERRPALAASFAALDSVPPERRLPAANVVGLLRGSDADLRDEYVIVGAHYDHVGMNAARAVDGDSIFNGADDDASGVVAMLETARQLAANPPARSVIFVAFTGEENGMTGTRWYIQDAPRPLERTVADIQIEMIGRPDSLSGGPGKGWLTGFERSSMGPMLSAAGLAIIADPRPAMNFFARSDNYPFARLGIPAHTISSFGGHTDYHQPSDEIDTIDFEHFAALVNETARAVRVIANGARPEWVEGGKP